MYLQSQDIFPKQNSNHDNYYKLKNSHALFIIYGFKRK